MDKNETKTPATGLWIAAALIGVAAAVFLSARRRTGRPVFDFDSVVDACDKAAQRLEDALLAEPQAQAS
jgi:hypothetical protein